jgi:hypothetical protein
LDRSGEPTSRLLEYPHHISSLSSFFIYCGIKRLDNPI